MASQRKIIRDQIKGLRGDASHYIEAAKRNEEIARTCTVEHHRIDAERAVAWYLAAAERKRAAARKLEEKYGI